MNQKIVLIGGLVVVAVVAIVLVWLTVPAMAPSDTDNATSTAPVDDAMSVTSTFFNAWLAARLSTTTNPYDAGVLDTPIISGTLRDKILVTKSTPLPENRDPVLCQTVTPERVGTKEVSVSADRAEVMVLARGFEVKSPHQSLVTLTLIDNKWQISDINCIQGETAPDREYDFEQVGYLLKNVPPPLDPQYWHLVFEQMGTPGHTVPLLLDANSICVATDGTEATCTDTDLIEGVKVLIKAGMTEEGATVQRLEFQAE